jgi:Holliday junction resolvase RusA-like endonuclease
VYKKAEALRNEDDFFYLAVNSEIRPKEPLKGPIHIRLKASLPRPKSVKRRGHVVKPDLDNLVKFALDCLTRAGYWEDDKQIVAIDAWKRYASSFATVGWHIEILNIDERTIA